MTEHASIVSRHGPAPTAAYPHAHVFGRKVWITAEAGRDPTSGEMVAGGPECQMNQAISNLAVILDECSSSLAHVIRTQIMYLHPDDLDALVRAYELRFTAPLPARTAFGVSFLAEEPGTELIRVQIDCVAKLV